MSGPKVFGDYFLLTMLAQGGMGTIHLAKRVGFRADIQRFFVVKKLPRGHANARDLRRFHDEARVVVTLNHRALCHVFDVGVVDDEHYLAMELIEGVNLQEAVAKTTLAQPIALYVIDEMLDALDYAHQHRDPATGAPLQIVHRDVSPHNVMLSFQGGVKLIDFGLVSSTLKEERTQNGVVVGKLEYMSPEQARGEPLDARSDVYAAAIIAFELLSGRRFYAGLSKSALSTAVVEGNHTPSFDGIDERLLTPLRRALAPERDDRTASCAAFQAELAAVPRASSRDLREVLARTLPDEKARLEALVRSFRDVGTENEVPTKVRYLARSSESDVSEEPTLITEPRAPAAAPRTTSATVPARRERPLVVAILAAAALALIVAVAFFAARSDSTTTAERPPTSSTSPAAASDAQPPRSSASTDAHAAIPAAAGDARAADAGAADGAARDAGARAADARGTGGHDAGPGVNDAGTTDASARDVDDAVPSTTGAHAHKPPKHARPPPTPLPDLAAQMDYLAHWCVRVPCAKPVLASRGRIPLLDVVGLGALRRDASACVVECRR